MYPKITVVFKIVRYVEIRVQYRSEPFIERFYISVKPYVFVGLVKRNFNSVDIVTSTCKAKISIKLSQKIRSLEI